MAYIAVEVHIYSMTKRACVLVPGAGEPRQRLSINA
jgi:hypothetical protein